MCPISSSVKWWMTARYEKEKDKKEMKKDNPYKLNKTMASPLA